MLSIDEAIAHARENYNDIINTTYNKCQYEHLSCEGCATPTCKEIADENLQVAEWLEELKVYQQHEIICNKGYNAGYNKAIDDLLGGMNQITYNCQDADELFEKICDLAEQLKAGGAE